MELVRRTLAVLWTPLAGVVGVLDGLLVVLGGGVSFRRLCGGNMKYDAAFSLL